MYSPIRPTLAVQSVPPLAVSNPMEQKKRTIRNHYVPQFYLKNFSKDRSNIRLYNFDREKELCGPIRGQAATNNFYSPEIEKTFGEVERRSGPVFKDLMKAPMQVCDPYAKEVLQMFVGFQSLRTQQAATASSSLEQGLVELSAKHGVKSKGFLEQLRQVALTDVERVLLGIRSCAKSMETLETCLVVNESGKELITSDDPVVRYNQYREGITRTGNAGWNAVGLQAFCPISPKLLAILYDPHVYKVKGFSPEKPVIVTKRPEDIIQLNALQVLHAWRNVYFLGEQDARGIAAHYNNWAKRRQGNRYVVEAYVDSTGEGLLAFYREPLRFGLKLSFMSVEKRHLAIPLKFRANASRTGKALIWDKEDDRRIGKPTFVVRG